MSLYKQYIDYITTFINLDKNEWTFKSNPNYTYMLEHVDVNQGNEYLFNIKNKFNEFYNNNKQYLIDLSNKNDLYGKTIKYNIESFNTCSPTNLRYILHSLLILTYINECGLKDMDLIEIGGGYGGLCFYINKLSKLFNININSYTIFDLPEALSLQSKYLNALDINNINFCGINNINNIKNNSFLISNYAFSEISLDLQKEYTNKLLNPYVSHGFIAWNNIDVYNLIDNKKIVKEIEYPLTGKKNFYVRFEPL